MMPSEKIKQAHKEWKISQEIQDIKNGRWGFLLGFIVCVGVAIYLINL